MGAQRFSDDSVTSATRAVVIASGFILAKLRDPEFLAISSSPPDVVEQAEPDPQPPSVGGRLASLARQGGDRARRGIATGMERWASERPGSLHWDGLSLEDRCAWWLSRMGTVTAALASLPGVAGAAAGQVPVGDLVSAAGQALLLCAIAQEYGVSDEDDQVLLVTEVVLGRELDGVEGGRVAHRQAQAEAVELAPELSEPSGQSSARGRTLATGKALVRMGRSLSSLQDELDQRPRAHVGQRMAAAVPVVGVVGQFRGERRGLRLASERGHDWCRLRRARSEHHLDTAAVSAALPAPPAPPAPDVGRLALAHGDAAGGRAADMTRSELYDLLGTFEQARTAQGDRFHTSPHIEGHFFYETGDQRVAIVVWGCEESWRLSVFSCARMGMRPTFELYRYVSRWRSTSGVGAPYVVENGAAAVMCETTIDSSQLVDDVSAWRLISSTIDRVGDTALRLGHDLAQADGVPFTAEGGVGLALALGWWEVRDEHVERVLGS